MAAQNLSGDGHLHSTSRLNSPVTFIAVFNTFVSVSTFLGNAVILTALHKESSLHPPSKLLLRSLAVTDLCVGLISQPLFVTYCMSIVNEHWNISRYVSAAAFTTAGIFCGVSVMTLTAISVDRLLALSLGLRYRQVVTLKRTYAMVIAIWVVCTVSSALQLWIKSITLWYRVIVKSLCLVISSFSYAKIFFTLRHQQNQVQSHVQQPNQANQLNIVRYKRAVSTAIWLQLTLIVCYLPDGVMTTLMACGRQPLSVQIAWYHAVTLVFLNSSLNPILYYWKFQEVRQGVKDTIRQVFRLCFSS